MADTVLSDSVKGLDIDVPATGVSATMEIVAPKLPQAERVDKFLMTRTKLSRSALQRLFEQEKILVNGTVCKKNYKVKTGDVFKIVTSNDTGSKELQPVEGNLNVVYEDEHIAVLNKVAGMAVHPGQGEDANEKVTLVNVLLHRYGREGLCEGEQEGDLERPGIVHRLDKDTSGLMIICKTNDAHAKLKEMFAKKSKKDDSADSSSTAPFSPGIALPSFGSSPSSETALKKTYWALVLGKVGALSGTIDTPLTRHAKQGHKMVATTPLDTKGKVAITHYKVLKYWHLQKQSYTLLEVNIETGRTHQIRVHMSSNAHPIVGDALYATKHNSHNVPFLLLTSKELRFEHPVSKEKMHFSIELPDHFAQFISKLDAQQASFDKSNAAKKPKSLHNPYETNNEDLLI